MLVRRVSTFSTPHHCERHDRDRRVCGLSPISTKGPNNASNRGRGRGRRRGRVREIPAKPVDSMSTYFFGKDRVKSRAAFSSLRRRVSSANASGAALTQPYICRPCIIIGAIPGVVSAQASFPLPSLTNIPSSRAPQRRLPLRSQARPPNMAFWVRQSTLDETQKFGQGAGYRR